MLNNNTITRPKCGEIWMCNLSIKDGSIQSGYRPVFILSNNKNNTYSPTLNIIPITSKMNKRKLPIHVELWKYKEYGLAMPSTMLVEQIMTIPIDYLDRRIGRIVDNTTLNNVCRAIEIQFPIMRLLSVIRNNTEKDLTKEDECGIMCVNEAM